MSATKFPSRHSFLLVNDKMHRFSANSNTNSTFYNSFRARPSSWSAFSPAAIQSLYYESFTQITVRSFVVIQTRYDNDEFRRHPPDVDLAFSSTSVAFLAVILEGGAAPSDWRGHRSPGDRHLVPCLCLVASGRIAGGGELTSQWKSRSWCIALTFPYAHFTQGSLISEVQYFFLSVSYQLCFTKKS
jgi:hypothetical protein